MEIFKDVIGYEGLYQVSNLGRVKSLPKKIKNGNGFSVRPEKYLKLEVTNRGYQRVMLYNNYKYERISVHRIVAINFINNPSIKETVNHKNGIKTDNRVDNLEWMTRSENMQHGFDIGIHKPPYGIRNTTAITEDEIKVIAKEYSNGNTSIRKLAKKYGIKANTIYYNIIPNKNNRFKKELWTV